MGGGSSPVVFAAVFAAIGALAVALTWIIAVRERRAARWQDQEEQVSCNPVRACPVAVMQCTLQRAD